MKITVLIENTAPPGLLQEEARERLLHLTTGMTMEF